MNVSENDEVLTLINTVVNNGYCIGCGACTAVSNSPLLIKMDEFGQYQASLDSSFPNNELMAKVLGVCPFHSTSVNEDQIGKELYGESCTYDNRIGYYATTYAGYVKQNGFRSNGSSGGIGKWILCEILRQKLVDAVIQVGQTGSTFSNGVLYNYRVYRSVDDTKAGSKSVYYPVEMSEVFKYIKENPGRYAITGIPCFVKAIRLLAKQEPIFMNRIKFCIGLICGHMKSTKYADMIAWQHSVSPGSLRQIDFRKKIPGAKAYEKGVELKGILPEGEVVKVSKVNELFGTDYNLGFFKYRACDFCDDVVAETADISIGDAWLPEYYEDGLGTSIVIVRHPRLQAIIEEAIADDRVHLEPISPDRVAKSQEGGFRDRREGLAYRLHLTDIQGLWRPLKRVQPKCSHIGRARKKIYELRVEMAVKSHSVFSKARIAGDFLLFQAEMAKLVKKYRELYNSVPIYHKILPAIWAVIRKSKTKIHFFSNLLK